MMLLDRLLRPVLVSLIVESGLLPESRSGEKETVRGTRSEDSLAVLC